MLDRLLDIALVQIIRQHFERAGGDAPPWFRAQGDPVIGGALRAMHADPSHQWTVADLAAEAMMSRAAFARRFTELLGIAPLAYLTDWRMAPARERLRDGDAGLAQIAAELGYGSEYCSPPRSSATSRWARTVARAAAGARSRAARGVGVATVRVVAHGLG